VPAGGGLVFEAVVAILRVNSDEFVELIRLSRASRFLGLLCTQVEDEAGECVSDVSGLVSDASRRFTL
jgi:hypothetical protein